MGHLKNLTPEPQANQYAHPGTCASRWAVLTVGA